MHTATKGVDRRATDDVFQAEQAFASGDYTTAAVEAITDELRGAALVMLGEHEQGVDLLRGSKSARATFHRGFACWGLGENGQAARLLKRSIDSPQYGGLARRLLPFVLGKRVRVLLQGRDDPGCPDYDFVGAVRALDTFDVKTLGYPASSDIPLDHQTTYEQVLARLPVGWKPDFFLCHMVEDNPPPIGIERAYFPTLCHTQDFDRHFHHCGHYLKLFDGIITLGRADHAELAQISGVRTFVYPKLLGVSVKMNHQGEQERDVDVFVSGMLFNHTRAKAKHLFDVSQLPPHYKVELVDGYMTTEEYYRRLARAKVTFTFVNRWGLINGRAVEAISHGTCAVYQEGGELGLFLRETDGAVPYGPDNAMQTLMRVVDQWDSRYRDCGQRGAAKVKRVFDINTSLKRYLHFATLTALGGIRRKQRPVDPVFSQFRYPNRSPQRTWFHFDFSFKKLSALETGFRARYESSTSYEQLDAFGESSLYSNLHARPFAIPYARRDWFYPLVSRALLPVLAPLKQKYARYKWLKPVIACLPYSQRLRQDLFASVTAEQIDGLLLSARETYERLTREHPDRLAARYNLARLRVESGDKAGAMSDFEEILSNRSLVYQPTDLLFWREFHDAYFDYERMMEESVALARDGDDRHLRAIEAAIRESSRFYLAELCEQTGDTIKARQVLTSGQTEGWQFAPVLLARARIELKLGSAAEAERQYRAALALDRVLLTQIGDDELAELGQFGCSVDDLIGQRALLTERCPPKHESRRM